MVRVPLVLSFWLMVAAYVIHVIDESLLGGSFVEKVRQHWWPEYSWRMFFWFNTGYFVLMIASVIAYDMWGGFALALPLAWALERTFNAVWHVWWSVRFNEYSPGLVSTILIWMTDYFILRYRPATETIDAPVLGTAIAIGLTAACFLAFYIPVVKGRGLSRGASIRSKGGAA
jgi:hypothetical protein